MSRKVSMYKIINNLIVYMRKVRSIVLKKVFVIQSFHNFFLKHGYRCASIQEEGYSKS